MYLLISNNGEIDPRAFSLLGASSKRDEAEAIGFFGSGAKYALSILIRLGINFHVFSGENEIFFTTRKETFRDKEVSVIYINGQPTSLTVETGPKWTLLHAIRELYSNALDEENGRWAIVDYILTAPDRTAIYIECNDEINKFWMQAAKYFLSPDIRPLWETDEIKCFAPKDTGNLANFFRRRVWCCEDRDYEPAYSYDLHNISLNESRVTGSYDCMNYTSFGQTLRRLEYEEFVENFILNYAHKDVAEWKAMYYTYSAEPCLWKSLFEKHWQYVAEERDLAFFPEKLQHRVKVVSQTAFYFFKSIGIHTVGDWRGLQDPYTISEWPPGNAEDRVTKIAARLVDNGMNCHWPIHYGTFNDEMTVAMADMKKKKIILGKHALTLGDTELLRTLIEEHVHLDRNVTDGTRAQQNAYIDIIVGLMK